jgi:hypothetical protein
MQAWVNWVAYMDVNDSEEHTASVFRVEVSTGEVIKAGRKKVGGGLLRSKRRGNQIPLPLPWI